MKLPVLPLLLLGLMGALAPTSSKAQAAAPAASAASAPREGARPEVAKALNAASDAIRAKQYAEALRLVAEVDAMPNRTPFENFFLERVRGIAAAEAGDDAMAVKAFETMLAMNRLQGEDRLPFMEAITRAHFRAKNYAASVVALDRYVQAGGKNAETLGLRERANYLAGNFAAVIPGLDARIKEVLASGKVPDETSLRMLADSYNRVNNEAGYVRTVELLLQEYPKKEMWRDLVSRVQRREGVSDRQWLDAYRLLDAVGALQSASDYASFAEAALLCGLPLEAKRVLDTGYDARVLGVGPDAAKHAQLREQVNKQAAEDSKVLAANPTPRTTDAMVSTGEGHLSAGRIARGVELIEQGVTRGGLRRPEEARLRLAQAYLMAGNKAKALEAFKALSSITTGGFADLGRYWILAVEKG